MVSEASVYIAMFSTVIGIMIFAIATSRKMEIKSRASFMSANNSQSAMRLAWCLFSAGTGCWTLFSLPEIGVLAGSWGIIGYTLSSLLGLVVLNLTGPYVRLMLGDGMTFADFLSRRFGRIMQVYVACVGIFFQFILLASELTCVGDLTLVLAPNASPEATIIGIAVATNVYLLTGGLRASLTTNAMQGMQAVSLVLVVCVAIFIHVKVPEGAWAQTQVAAFTSDGFEVLVTLCIAITSSNLFQTGLWQRVFAANDDKSLKRACWLAACIVIPFTLCLALAGMISFLAFPEGVYLFSILVDMGTFWQFLTAMAVAPLASAVCNSLQLGIVAELITNFPRVNLFYARVICIALNLPAIAIALKHYNILDLFLVADLLCTATVGPMLLSVWPRAHYKGAIAGCASGLAVVFLCGCAVQKSFVGGFNWFLLPEGLYSTNSMITFVLALFVPIIVTIVVSLSLPQQELPLPMPLIPFNANNQDDDDEAEAAEGEDREEEARSSQSNLRTSPSNNSGRLSPPAPLGTPTPRAGGHYVAARTPPPVGASSTGLHMRLPPLSVAEDHA